MLQDWTNFLPRSGSKLDLPSLPEGSLALDASIEQNGLGATALYGNFNSMLGIGQSNGGGFIRIDSPNKRIIINDGVNDRIIIGYLG